VFKSIKKLQENESKKFINKEVKEAWIFRTLVMLSKVIEL